MYVTRPLSLYRKFPASLSTPPADVAGPNSGFLVIQDEESETTCCFGLCKENYLHDLPFPQNKKLTVHYSTGAGENESIFLNEVILIPVLNQPLSSNRYHAMVPRGKHKGEAYTNSKEEDKSSCCFCSCVRDVKPRPLDPNNTYQQVEISPYDAACSSRGQFLGKSVAPDGFPPYFFRWEGWQIYTSTPRNYELGEAPGVDSALRARLPEFNFPLSCERSEAVVVGKWYCPFMFVRDGTLRNQVERSMYYEMTLEQKWERIFESENSYGGSNTSVGVNVVVQTEVVSFPGSEVVEVNAANGVVWFRSSHNVGGQEGHVGLSSAIVEKMKWEEERAGWVGGANGQVRVERVEELEGMSGWRRFGSYVLVESFVLKRMDGSLVLSFGFKHTHQIKSKWE
ncbi:uncharacterized protein LOC131153071 [Malania oleifera]|uniref:uncharacterized protein LOC131153071 n=1 Tax=Malania oleifera TaxID=397392 RepID=UPI0025AE70DA|nr:uncharacterized protein LOC131153071 [Malania oleifera]